jgi:hypothetical protein
MEKLNVGMPVRLVASPNPIMYVMHINSDMVHCSWMHNGTRRSGDFPLASLEPVAIPRTGFGMVWTG